MVKGKLSNGFAYEVLEGKAKDWNFVLKVARVNETDDPFKTFILIDELLIDLLGEEQREAFIESFMDEKGNVPSPVVIEGFKELTASIAEKEKELKN